MNRIRVLLNYVMQLLTVFSLSPAIHANILQLNASVATAHIVRGIDVSNGHPAAYLGLDWSLANGIYAGGECYRTGADDKHFLATGCVSYMGYFVRRSQGQAVEASLSYHDYQLDYFGTWDYLELEFGWHFTKSLRAAIATSDDWHGRGFGSVRVQGESEFKVANKTRFELIAGVLALQSNAPENYFEYIEANLRYSNSRWRAAIGLFFQDKNIEPIIRFSTESAEVLFRLDYQIY